MGAAKIQDHYFVHGVVELLIRDKSFSNRYSAGVQTSLCKLLHGYYANILLHFNNEDNCSQSQEFDKLIKDMLLKGILNIRFWQVYHE